MHSDYSGPRHEPAGLCLLRDPGSCLCCPLRLVSRCCPQSCLGSFLLSSILCFVQQILPISSSQTMSSSPLLYFPAFDDSPPCLGYPSTMLVLGECPLATGHTPEVEGLSQIV